MFQLSGFYYICVILSVLNPPRSRSTSSNAMKPEVVPGYFGGQNDQARVAGLPGFL